MSPPELVSFVNTEFDRAVNWEDYEATFDDLMTDALKWKAEGNELFRYIISLYEMIFEAYCIAFSYQVCSESGRASMNLRWKSTRRSSTS